VVFVAPFILVDREITQTEVAGHYIVPGITSCPRRQQAAIWWTSERFEVYHSSVCRITSVGGRWNSIISVVTRLWTRWFGFWFLAGMWRVLSSPKTSRLVLWPPQPYMQWLEVLSVYLEADHSALSSAQLGICGTCTCTPCMCFYCVHRPNLISLIITLVDYIS